MRTNSPSRVMPALLTRMSTPPQLALGRLGQPLLTRRGRQRSAGNTHRRARRVGGQCVQLLRAGAVQAHRRAGACRARAIASPMPPVAPVTSAFFPVRSNMSHSSPLMVCADRRCGARVGVSRRRTPPRRRRFRRRRPRGCGRCVARARTAPCRRRSRRVGVTPFAGQPLDALAPAHLAGHLLHQPLADLRRDRTSESAVTLATTGTRGRGDRRIGQRLRHAVGGRLHQPAMEGRGDRQQHRALGAPLLRQCRRPVRPRPAAGNDDLAAAIVVGGLADLALGRVLAELGDRLGIEADDRGHRALRRSAPPPAWHCRGCAAAAPHRRSKARRPRPAPNIRRANGRRHRRAVSTDEAFAPPAPGSPPSTPPSAPAGHSRSASACPRALRRSSPTASRRAPRRPRRRRRGWRRIGVIESAGPCRRSDCPVPERPMRWSCGSPCLRRLLVAKRVQAMVWSSPSLSSSRPDPCRARCDSRRLLRRAAHELSEWPPETCATRRASG